MLLNLFKLNLNRDDVMKKEWIQYYLEVFPAARQKEKDSSGKPVEPWKFEVVPKRTEIDLERKSKAPIPRRVLLTLQDRLFKEGQYFATDGSHMGFSPRRLFEESGGDPEIPVTATYKTKDLADRDRPRGSVVGTYGPADAGVDTGGAKAKQTGPSFNYALRVKASCDEDDPDMDG